MNAYKSVFFWLREQLKQFNQSYIRLLELDNIRKSRVVCATLIFFHAFFYISILCNQNFELFNSVYLSKILTCFQVFICISTLLLISSYFIKTNPRSEFYFPIFCVGFYSGSLMMVGYIAGMMTILTGVFTIGSILSGLLLFNRRIMFYASLPCIAVFFVTSFLNVFNILPYAPLYKAFTMIPAETQNYIILVNLFSTTLIAIILVTFFNTFLERWIDRERQQRLMMTLDPLTQTLNRRGVDQHFQQRLTNNQIPSYCLALLDIDYFKKINDTYGHDCGDQVLINLAQLLRLNIRKQDILARLGGEEFLIIFENTSIELAQHILERCRRTIEQYQLDYQGQPIRFTASFGLSLETTSPHHDDILKAADQALYQAKHAGRNRIETQLLHV